MENMKKNRNIKNQERINSAEVRDILVENPLLPVRIKSDFPSE